MLECLNIVNFTNIEVFVGNKVCRLEISPLTGVIGVYFAKECINAVDSFSSTLGPTKNVF